MRITLDTEKYTVEVHEAANYEELTTLVDALVEHLKWPADKVKLVQPQPLASSMPITSPFDPPFTVFCNATETGITATMKGTFTNT